MSQSRSVDKPSNTNDLKPLYVRSIVNSFGSGAVNPFLGVYAVEQLNASASEMGWFQSISNLAPNMMQVLWGKLSDKIGRRIPFIIIGGLITAALWIPLMFVTSATQLIVVIAVQSLLGSMATPTWTALIGDLAHLSKRGITTATINRSAAVGSLLATFAAGYLMVMIKGTLQQALFIPLLVAVFCGVVSSLIMIFVHEKPNPNPNNLSSGSVFGINDVAKQVRSTPNFVRFCVANAIFGFFMTLCWPLFSITTISVLNATMLEVALMSVINGAAVIALQPWGGKLVDRVGRRSLIVVYRLCLIIVPVFYGLASSVYHIYLLNLILGVLTAFGEVAIFAYLLDITQEELRGTIIAFYNLVNGLVFFTGSLVGGYLGNYLIGIFGLILGLQLVYALSAIGRCAGALTFLTLKEPYRYPSTLRKELRSMMGRLPWMPERGPTQE